MSGRLAQSIVEELRDRGAGTIRNLLGMESPDAQAFWQVEGFERDMVRMSLYPRA